MDVSPESLPAAIDENVAFGLRDMNETMPSKDSIPPLLGEEGSLLVTREWMQLRQGVQPQWFWTDREPNWEATDYALA